MSIDEILNSFKIIGLILLSFKMVYIWKLREKCNSHEKHMYCYFWIAIDFLLQKCYKAVVKNCQPFFLSKLIFSDSDFRTELIFSNSDYRKSILFIRFHFLPKFDRFIKKSCFCLFWIFHSCVFLTMSLY